MKYQGAHWVIVSCMVWILAGCGPDRPPSAPLPMNETPVTRFSSGTEWRDAREFLSPGRWTWEFDDCGPSDAIRFSVLPDPIATTPFRFEVVAGRTTLAEETLAANSTQWYDARIDLPSSLSPGTSVEVVFESSSRFWVGPLERVRAEDTPTNVLVILIDTLRLDHLGCYGYARDTSPNLDALAQDSVRFTQLTPQSSWTRPSVASLLTGTYPSRHGAEDRNNVLRRGLPSLARSLEAAGFETTGFMSNVNCIPYWGFGNDFQRFVDVDSSLLVNYDDAKIVERAMQWIAYARGRPWFVYAHTLGPHDPYEAPAPFSGKFSAPDSSEPDSQQSTIDRYDEEIAYTDFQIGRLMERIKEQGLYDDTLILVLSDHGEEFWEHGGVGHGKTLYEEQLRVPLLIKLPGGSHGGEVREHLVEVVDIAPTVLELVGAPAEPRFHGDSFAGIVRGADKPSGMGFSSLMLESGAMRAAKTSEQKYIEDMIKDSKAWFDLVLDPKESNPMGLPPPGAGALERYAAGRSATGAEGLHILITGAFGSGETISGKIEGEGLGRARLQYGAQNGRLAESENTVDFEVTLASGLDTPPDLNDWYKSVDESAAARIHVLVDPDKDITLTLNRAGIVMPAEFVYLGPTKMHQELAGNTFKPGDLVADPDEFTPANLPESLGVYVWYVPDAESLRDDELDPAIRDALKKLGYMH
ncbi:MAG: hypothetical protein AMXMBFR84_49100 [Candidatus Hydrogenedentota bacterium]